MVGGLTSALLLNRDSLQSSYPHPGAANQIPSYHHAAYALSYKVAFPLQNSYPHPGAANQIPSHHQAACGLSYKVAFALQGSSISETLLATTQPILSGHRSPDYLTSIPASNSPRRRLIPFSIIQPGLSRLVPPSTFFRYKKNIS